LQIENWLKIANALTVSRLGGKNLKLKIKKPKNMTIIIQKGISNVNGNFMPKAMLGLQI
jgi:hypothetical protein